MKRRIITITEKDFDRLRSHLLRDGNEEEAALLVAGISETKQMTNFLVREVIPVPNDGFLEKWHVFLTISPDFMMPILKRCRYDRLSVILAHSHPFSGDLVTFSSIDANGERILMPKIQQRIPDRHHGAIVLGRTSVDARIWEKGKNKSRPMDSIRVIGPQIRTYQITSVAFPENPSNPATSQNRHDRQKLALGEAGQKKIQETTVGIVGTGGVGSLVLQELVHLGVEKFIIIDDDLVEESNLSRIVGSMPKDATNRTPKIKVMKRLGRQINPEVRISSVKDSVNNAQVALILRDADVIFCCTDNLLSRIVLNRMAFQYLIPLIDMGIDIQCNEQGKITTAGGRVMVILPDGPCLECLGILNSEMIQQEMRQIEEGQRARRSYISGATVEAPSVISLNGVIASLAVTAFLSLLTGFESQKDPDTYQVYRVLKGDVRLATMTPTNACTLCKEVKSLGDGVNLPCDMSRKEMQTNV